jgi:hypothetical protein
LGKGEVSAWTVLISEGFNQLIESLDGTSLNLEVGCHSGCCLYRVVAVRAWRVVQVSR